MDIYIYTKEIFKFFRCHFVKNYFFEPKLLHAFYRIFKKGGGGGGGGVERTPTESVTDSLFMHMFYVSIL